MYQLPQQFGAYTLLERIGFGGTSEVFLARWRGQEDLGHVVIKRLHPDLNYEQQFVDMLVDEARITAWLVHPNICRVLDFGHVDGAHYIAMEHVPGQDLKTVLDLWQRAGAVLPLEASVFIVSEILAGLDHAHAQRDDQGTPLGIVHRDISPHNVIIAADGQVKIIDFGIAKARQRLVKTQVGVVKGKHLYMSPEQAAGGAVDHRTDVFAAGVVLHELIRGEAYATQSDSELVLKMRQAGFGLEPITHYAPNTPRDLERIIQLAVAPDSAQRYPTASSFREALLGFLQRQWTPFSTRDLAELLRRGAHEPAQRASAPVRLPVAGRPARTPSARQRKQMTHRLGVEAEEQQWPQREPAPPLGAERTAVDQVALEPPTPTRVTPQTAADTYSARTGEVAQSTGDDWDDDRNWDEEEDTAAEGAPAPFQDASTDIMQPSDLAWYWSDDKDNDKKKE